MGHAARALGQRGPGLRSAPLKGTTRAAQEAATPRAVWLRFLLVAAYAALILSRLPNVFIKGRFWAEEGAVYFFRAWREPWPDALVWVHTGYLNLTASASAVLARYLVPLPDAPFVTSTISLLVQLLPAILLCVSGIRWLRHPLALWCAMLLLAAPPFAGEVWLNTITSQFHLTLAAAIILASEVRSGSAGVLQNAVLLWTPLSSPGSVALAPLFVLRALADRSRGHATQAGLMSIGAVVQALVLLRHPVAGRDHGLGPIGLVCVFYVKNIITPLLGESAALGRGRQMEAAFLHHTPVFFPVVITVAALGLAAIAAWRSRDRAIIYLFSAAVVVAFVSYAAALTLGHPFYMLRPGFGARYAYVPNVLLSLALFGLAISGTRLVRPMAALLCVAILFTGARWYYDVAPAMANGPAWSVEVRKLAAAPDARLQLWPPWFSMYLPPPARRR